MCDKLIRRSREREREREETTERVRVSEIDSICMSNEAVYKYTPMAEMNDRWMFLSTRFTQSSSYPTKVR